MINQLITLDNRLQDRTDIYYRPERDLLINQPFQVKVDPFLNRSLKKAKDNNEKFDDTLIFGHMMKQRGEHLNDKPTEVILKRKRSEQTGISHSLLSRGQVPET